MKKQKKRLLVTGVVGTVVTFLCCFTPVLLILLGSVGLGALTGYLDYVLFPVLAIFIGLTFYAFYKNEKSISNGEK
ncbi:mercury resistance system transport protein MerF [Filobacillus milosensis]|uniref:Mercury resistance system transport protein MerF n=1 Tax=Filobacillus milosensis TaxID=94137 RepID=A0A4Y8IHE6_9BACI|nr:mercury resistance system transport protein MerF [Filobacillus milosensis]TFB18493.1 mercury resistance system transport protein MerF [Filobacillus milosensis]